jgi:putative cell wall-binding protein
MPVLSGFKNLAGKDQAEIEAEAMDAIDKDFFNSLGSAIVQNFDDKQVYGLIKELMDCVLVVEGGRKSQLSKCFAVHFAGWYDPIIPLTVEVIKHNGFFGLIAKAINLTKASV